MTDTPKIWHHGRPFPDLEFHPDRPAFFAAERADVGQFAEEIGYVISAEITVKNPIRESDLLWLGEEMGLDDVFAEDYDGFPGPSDYLFDERVRRRLEEMGHDGYLDWDGPVYAVIVWNPDQIRIVGHAPFLGASVDEAAGAPTP